MNLLKEQSMSCTLAMTADCWSSHGKSYIGVTGHWIDVYPGSGEKVCMYGTQTTEAITHL
jgi:hypothetical protein